MVSSLQGKNKFKMAQVLSLFSSNITVSTTRLESFFFTLPISFTLAKLFRTLFQITWQFFSEPTSAPVSQSGIMEVQPRIHPVLQPSPIAVSGSGGRGRGTGSEHCVATDAMFTTTKLAFAGRLIPSHTCILTFTLFSSSLDSKKGSLIWRKLVFNSNIPEKKLKSYGSWEKLEGPDDHPAAIPGRMRHSWKPLV